MHHLVRGVAVGADDIGEFRGAEAVAKREVEQLGVALTECVDRVPDQRDDLAVFGRARRIIGTGDAIFDAEAGALDHLHALGVVRGTPLFLPLTVECLVAGDTQQPASERVRLFELGQ
jgi:hypothetical protein